MMMKIMLKHNANDLKKPPVTEEPPENAAAEVRTFSLEERWQEEILNQEDHEKLNKLLMADDDEPVNKMRINWPRKGAHFKKNSEKRKN